MTRTPESPRLHPTRDAAATSRPTTTAVDEPSISAAATASASAAATPVGPRARTPAAVPVASARA